MVVARVHIVLSPAAYADLLRLEAFLWESGDPLAADIMAFVLDGLQVLTHQPGVGRPIAEGLRELIINRGRGGYLARYQFDLRNQRVLVLGIRHQREAGYTEEDV